MKKESGEKPELSRSRNVENKRQCHWETGKTLKRGSRAGILACI